MTQSFALISTQRDPEEPVVRFSLPEGTCLWPSRSVSGCYSGTGVAKRNFYFEREKKVTRG